MITLAALPSSALEAIRTHLAAVYPDEGCGVVLQDGGLEALPTINVARDRAHAFAIGPKTLAMLALRLKAGAQLVAIYHSHCDAPAIFSDSDRHYAAAWPDALHLVFAVTAAGVIGQHAYRADGTCVDEPVLELA